MTRPAGQFPGDPGREAGSTLTGDHSPRREPPGQRPPLSQVFTNKGTCGARITPDDLARVYYELTHPPGVSANREAQGVGRGPLPTIASPSDCTPGGDT